MNGKVAGVWKRSVKKDEIVIEKILFRKSNRLENKAFEQKALEYALFEGKNYGTRTALPAMKALGSKNPDQT